MYFPFLRGKQFELIALKESSQLLAEKNQIVSPIIEPVKISPTFKTTLGELRQKKVNCNIIVNPDVGDLTSSSSNILSIIKELYEGYDNYQIAIHVNGKQKIQPLLEDIKTNRLTFSGLTLIHDCVDEEIQELISKIDAYFPIKYNVVNIDKTSSRYYRQFSQATRVRLEDPFNSQQRNSDYLRIDESSFSEEHLFYKEDGYIGFSDYLTVGNNYSESGFLPYAVAIHITYADANDKIKVKHFVSESNEDTSDVGGKFSEALDKLVGWCDVENIDSNAIQKFRELSYNGHFPGLGSIKKLSIMNHIELVLNLI